ncbi:MAG: glycine cleavage system aminomethyltransferase GcvT [Chloroflexi bacterium]|nr:glycine cleavage system aminomethyltransferase GcvT [Chloroflexota bacterium]
MSELNRTVLYDTHVALGARMVPFAGWEMPVQYESPIEEHKTVREAVGLFDIDHMGQFLVEGPDAMRYLNYMTTNDVSKLEVWDAAYSLMCYADGGTIDDLFLYRLPEAYYVVVNASNRAKNRKWMQAHLTGFDVSITDVSDETYMLALQGPKAQETLQQVVGMDLNELPFHTATRTQVSGVDVILGNTGYTGEYGYELFFPAEQAVQVWTSLTDLGARPIGLAARDSLRFEACLPLYGHELGPDITPLDAGLGFAVKTDKPDFIGRDALLKQRLEKPERRLVCLEMVDKGVPREGYEVQIDGASGFVTTGMYCPTCEIYAAMALVPRSLAKTGHEVDVIIRGSAKKARIVKRPFYTPAYRR